MQVNDYICDTCGESCGEGCEINGKKIPLVAYLVVGVPPSYKGEPVDLNAPGSYVPQIVRELMAQPIARREWCVKCFAKAFGLELLEAPQPEAADAHGEDDASQPGSPAG